MGCRKGPPFGPGVPWWLDTSAWVRQRDPAAIDRWKATLAAGAAQPDGHDDTLASVMGFPSVRLDRD